jgi:glycosyltransferase involved in cell wall biosynthesis
MRVLYLTNAAHIGGGNRSLLSLWEGLKTHRIVPLPVCPADGPMVRTCLDAGYECQIVEYEQPSWRHPFGTLRGARQWETLLARVRPDLVHANDFHGARSIVLAAARQRTPVICHVQFHQEDPYLRWAFRGLPKPAAFICNSQATRDLVEPGLRAACPQSEIALVHNCVSIETFTPRADLLHASPRLRVGIVGNLIPIKGHHEFLTMARHLTDEALDVEYWIVGEDVQGTGHRRTLEALTHELGLGDRVRFFGHRSDVPDLMRQLDVLVCPSHVEPFGINLIEGMACAVAVVGTRVGGIPEVIEEGVTGLLVPPKAPQALAESVGWLLRNPDRRLIMGQAGRRRVLERFTVEKHTSEIVALYHRVATERTAESVGCEGSPEMGPLEPRLTRTDR